MLFSYPAIRINRQGIPAGRATLNGVTYEVYPVVAIVAGVLNGELVTQAEIGRYIDSWNNKPVPVHHPKVGNTHVSANTPDQIEKRSIGIFMNARMDGDRLLGEFWIDPRKAAAIGNDGLKVLAALRDGEPIEVSTAYFRSLVAQSGNHNGRPYSHLAQNLVPDHVAILPGEVGACSWGDGCGVRSNQLVFNCDHSAGGSCACSSTQTPHTEVNMLLAINRAVAASFAANSTVQMVLDAVTKGATDEEKHFVEAATNASKAEGATVQSVLQAVIDAKKPDVATNAQTVTAVTTAPVQTVPNTQAQNGQPATPPVQANAQAVNTAPIPAATLAANEVQALQALAKQIGALGGADAVGRLLVNAQQQEAAERGGVIAGIKANSRNPFSDQALATMPTSILKQMLESWGDTAFDYSASLAGNGDGRGQLPADFAINKPMEWFVPAKEGTNG